MFSWGIVSGMFAFIGPISAATGLSNERVFYILRFMLGAAEAGFFPGIIFYLTLWFPSVYRARVVALFMLAIPFSSIHRRAGFRRAAEPDGARAGRLAVALHHRGGAFDPDGARRHLLPHRPAGAGSLAGEPERTWLQGRLDAESRQKQAAEHFGIGKALATHGCWPAPSSISA